MNVYFYFGQTPELAALPSQEYRDSVHTTAWRQLRSERPHLWTRSFLIVIGSAAIACLIGFLCLEFLPEGPWKRWLLESSPIPFIGGIGAGIGVLIHIHLLATALRPYYAEIIAERSAR
ncbi:MAG TPA: hypothetical protein DD473_21100 [Planctomycetaceae bacterium]|nr:hypothetical protein [Planctomycetaceae bacterium]